LLSSSSSAGALEGEVAVAAAAAVILHPEKSGRRRSCCQLLLCVAVVAGCYDRGACMGGGRRWNPQWRHWPAARGAGRRGACCVRGTAGARQGPRRSIVVGARCDARARFLDPCAGAAGWAAIAAAAWSAAGADAARPPWHGGEAGAPAPAPTCGRGGAVGHQCGSATAAARRAPRCRRSATTCRRRRSQGGGIAARRAATRSRRLPRRTLLAASNSSSQLPLDDCRLALLPESIPPTRNVRARPRPAGALGRGGATKLRPWGH